MLKSFRRRVFPFKLFLGNSSLVYSIGGVQIVLEIGPRGKRRRRGSAGAEMPARDDEPGYDRYRYRWRWRYRYRYMRYRNRYSYRIKKYRYRKWM